MAFLSGYTTRKKITIDKDKIDSNLTDFPVLVKLTSSNFDFSKANSDGYDIRFTSADGTTLLKYERERHDATNKLAEYWVKIPSISSTANTIFYLYYRVEDTADGADPANVWDSNFKGVWHMKDLTTSTIEDSTSNNNDGTKKAANEPIQADGQIAKAQSFDGSDDKIINSSPSLITGNNSFTKEAWIKSLYKGTEDKHPNIVSWGKYVTNQANGLALKADISGNPQVLQWFYANDYAWDVQDLTNAWHHLVITYSSPTLELFIDGVSQGQVTVSGTPNVQNANLEIGYCINSNNYFNGLIDELRISNVARSSAWIKASYNSGNNSLVSYGGEEGEGIDNVLFFGCNF